MEGREYREYSPPCAAEEDGPFGCMKRKRSRNNKRRFSDEQIRSLETMFENETRLEPRKKVQLARELGLQPRQVAIWFQNKRARYKSKQLERDYGVLRANYNSLANRFENLKKEKQALLIQLQRLNDLMHKSEGEGQCCRQDLAGNSIDGESDNGDANKVEFEEEADVKAEEYFGPNLLEMVEPADSSLTSPEDWGNFDSDGLFNQSSTSYQWWDFWS